MKPLRVPRPCSTLQLIIGLLLLCLLPLARLEAADALTQLTRLLNRADDAQFQLDILRGLHAALQGHPSAPMPAGWEVVETRLASSPNAEVRTLAQTLSLTFGSSRARAALQAIALDPKADPAARGAALNSLLGIREPKLPWVLQQLISDPAVRGVAVRGLAAYYDAGTPAAILNAYPNFAASEKRDALNTLASRPAFAKPLLTAVAAGTVPKTDLTADLVRQLRNLKDPAIATQITEVWGVMKDTSPDMQAEIDKVKRVYGAGGSTPGDAPRGRVVFNRICAQCHHLFDSGGSVGPDITGANRSDLDYLLQNILYPNAVIPNEYRASVVETKDGRVITGIVKGRDATGVRVQTATELVNLPASEVAKVEAAELSMMPEGLLAPLKEPEIRDLLYYLSRPGQVPLPADGK